MKQKRAIRNIACFLMIVLIGLFLVPWNNDTSLLYAADSSNTNKPPAAAPAATTQAKAVVPTAAPGQVTQELPNESAFQTVAENDSLKLAVDPATAHFKVEHKHTGQVWRSYPDPALWSKETIAGTWRKNLLSPIMLELIDATNSKSQPKIINLLEDKGMLEQFQTTSNGFKTVFHFTVSGFKIPAEVILKDNYVEVKIKDEQIQEGKLSLLNVKLYPLFGAQPYQAEEEGYLLIPDGSGALIRFKPNQANDKSVYRENVYGADASFFNENTSRNGINLPAFGLKSGRLAFVGVMTSGEEYAKVFASPGGAYGNYNWITPEWQYRTKFFQSTSRRGDKGFFTYSKERFTKDRAIRYYLLEPSKSDYTGMAEQFRTYLLQTKGLQPVKPRNAEVPFYVDFIGADTKKGFLWDKYLKGTTTKEAAEIVTQLKEQGINNITVHYAGWQHDGFSSHGGLFPIDSRIGGEEGMKQFIQLAHNLKIPVFLTANYMLNSNGRDGFWQTFDGLRNLAGTVLEFENYANHEWTTLVSPRFMAKVIDKDLKKYKELGADGLYFYDGIGRYSNSDFNKSYKANRSEVIGIQNDILKQVKGTLGSVSIEGGNFYALGDAGHVHHLGDTYSYDIFVDEPVPFEQIALHGIVTYTSEWSNLREQYRNEFLRNIEFGSYPSYVFTAAASGSMKGAFSVWFYSMHYKDWLAKAAEEYRKFNEALGDVQDQFIISHRTLAPNVKETSYQNGKTIVVNYNTKEYTDGSLRVPAQDFIVTKGGAMR